MQISTTQGVIASKKKFSTVVYMARFNERARVTPGNLRSLAESLRRAAEMHERLAEWMESDKVPHVDTRSIKTEVTALVDISRFLGSAFEAYQEEASANAVQDIAGALAYFNKQAKRMQAAVVIAFPDADAAEAKPAEQFGQSVGEAAAEHAREKEGKAKRKPIRR